MEILPIDTHDEASLLSRARQGEESAFRLLYDRHAVLLFRFLLQFDRTGSEAEEWTQRAFIRAFGALERFDGRSAFRSWLFSIALNEMRMDRRRHQLLLMEDAEPAEVEPAEEGDGMLEWSVTLRTLLAELDETKRAVLLLYEVEGYSHAEIAGMLGIAESSSRTFLTRAKQRLRERLRTTKG